MTLSRSVGFSLILSAVFAMAACKSKEEGPGVDGLGGTPPRPSLSATLATERIASCVGNEAAEASTTFTVRVKNEGEATATLGFRFEGPGSPRFTLVNAPPDSLEPGGTIELAVRFQPDVLGEVVSSLFITDGDNETSDPVVVLVGEGLALSPTPTLEVQVPVEGSTDFGSCDSFGSCRVNFPATFYGGSTFLDVKVRNAGCPQLAVTGLNVTKGAGGGPNLAYFVEQPILLPSNTDPLLITGGATSETVFRIRFQPEADTSGSDYREGVLTFRTNDPQAAEYSISLAGEGSTPATYAEPETCAFSDANDACGFETKVANRARFTLHNAGLVDAQITSAFENGGQGRFAVSSGAGTQTLPASGSINLEVSYSESPGAPFATDRLIVKSTVGGQPAGETYLTVGGGRAPVLATEPATTVDFSSPGQAEVTRTVRITNAEDAGVLILQRFTLEGSSYFSLEAPPAAGTLVQPGASVDLAVRYQRPAAGGTQAATLRIETNDPAFSAPTFKVLTLFSDTPVNQVPVADIRVRVLGETAWKSGPLNQSLTAIDGPDKIVELTCDTSYDPQLAGPPKPVSQCEFRLVKKPLRANQTTLQSDGERIDTYVGENVNTVQLRLTPNVFGQYQVDVFAYDAEGQRSSQPARQNIFAIQ